MANYEQIRLQNIEDNKRILRELGIFSCIDNKRVIQQKRKYVPKTDKPALKRKRVEEWKPDPEDGNYGSNFSSKRRRSSRISGLPVDATPLPDEEEEEERKPKTPATPKLPMSYGAIEGVEVGRTWDMRSECSCDGIHRPWVAGIHGGPEGAYSIALSGGYEDDIDLGLSFTFTGEGGRDLKGTKNNPKNLRTAPQSKDQSLSRGNLALSLNLEFSNPVRVIRGYKSASIFAPEDGYRYDGLYKVEKAWYTGGLSGHMVWKFALSRLQDQAPPPWELVGGKDGNEDVNNNVIDLKADSENKENEPPTTNPDSVPVNDQVKEEAFNSENQEKGKSSEVTGEVPVIKSEEGNVEEEKMPLATEEAVKMETDKLEVETVTKMTEENLKEAAADTEQETALETEKETTIMTEKETTPEIEKETEDGAEKGTKMEAEKGTIRDCKEIKSGSSKKRNVPNFKGNVKQSAKNVVNAEKMDGKGSKKKGKADSKKEVSGSKPWKQTKLLWK